MSTTVVYPKAGVHMSSVAPGRVSIPREFLQASATQTWGLVARAACIWLVPSLLAFSLLGTGLWRTPAAWLLVTPLFLCAGQGLHLFGIIGHDGFHGNLHRSRTKSLLIGMLGSTILPLHCDVGFSISHAEHHRWVNGERDPDALLLRRYRSYLARILLVRTSVTRVYLRYTLRLALGRWPADQVIRTGMKLDTLTWLARLNLVCSAAWLTLFVTLTIRSPLAGVCVLWAPYLGAALLSGMRPYVEHAGTSSEKLRAARSYIHPLFTFLFGGTNYHLAHHLFPRVPCYKLPSFHRWLESSGYFGDAQLNIDRGLLGYPQYPALRYPGSADD